MMRLLTFLFAWSAAAQIVPIQQAAWTMGAAPLRAFGSGPFFGYNGGTNRVPFYDNTNLLIDECAWALFNPGFPVLLITNGGGTNVSFYVQGSQSAQIAKAWAWGASATNILIADIETSAPEFGHPAFANVQWWTNPVTGYRGVWVASATAVTNELTVVDHHATTQLGVIASVLPRGSYVMPIKIGSFLSDLGFAVAYAVTNGAKIILINSGVNRLRVAHTNGFAQAFTSNVLVICPFAEDGLNYDTVYAAATDQWALDFPSAFQWVSYTNSHVIADSGGTPKTNDNIVFGNGVLFTNILSVGPMLRDGTFFTAGSYSTNYLNLVAPGRTVVTANTNGGYTFVSGTSPSAAYAVGVSAMLMERRPTWTCYQIRSKMLASVDVRSGMETKTRSSGSLNAWKALQ